MVKGSYARAHQALSRQYLDRRVRRQLEQLREREGQPLLPLVVLQGLGVQVLPRQKGRGW